MCLSSATLYRTGNDSSVIDALVQAALAGKEVTAVVELRAFRRRGELKLPTNFRLRPHVSYGLVGINHAKRTWSSGVKAALKRYVHLGTGNYHAGTAQSYTIWPLTSVLPSRMTCKSIQQLTAMGKPGKMKKILLAPFTLHKGMLTWINREISFANAGKPARIIAKMNAWSNEHLEASTARPGGGQN